MPQDLFTKRTFAWLELLQPNNSGMVALTFLPRPPKPCVESSLTPHTADKVRSMAETSRCSHFLMQTFLSGQPPEEILSNSDALESLSEVNAQAA